MIFNTAQKHLFLFLFLLTLPALPGCGRDTSSGDLKIEKIEWDRSLRLPPDGSREAIGVAGAFSGFVGDRLVIAGGANFPDAAPWNGGHKTWWRTLYSRMVADSAAAWRIEPNGLPRALAYGISIQLPDGLLCIGGCDSARCYADLFSIRESDGRLVVSNDWPALPVPLANATGCLAGNRIYVAGGQSSMTEQEATRHFFVLDLTHREKGWQELSPWPGEARGYAVSVAQNNGTDLCFYLFGGRDFKPDGSMQVLTDGFVYNPRIDRWEKLPGSFPVMAGTAFASGDSQIVFLGGVPWLLPGSDAHPGFDTTVRVYDVGSGELTTLGVSPYPIAVTTTLAHRAGSFYIASGEVKPGIRTPLILKGTVVFENPHSPLKKE